MISLSESRKLYEELFNNGAEIFERNSINHKSPQHTEDSSDDRYCPECKGLIVYHFGIPACSVCGLETPNMAIGRKKRLTEMTPPEIDAFQIYYRIRETDVRTNL